MLEAAALVEEVAPGAAAAGGAVAAGVLGLGVALPARVVPNDEVAERLAVEGAWIERRTGIRERRWLRDGETLAGIATEAARAALDDAGVDAAGLDAVIAATFTADDLTPGVAALVAGALGAHAAAVDVNAACVGFLHAVDLAAATIGSGRAARVLVIGAEGPSRHLDLGDRRTAGLFGDGAGAVVLGAGRGTVFPFVLRSAGEHAGLVRAPRSDGLIRMEGHETFLLATSSLAEATADAVAAAGLTLADVDRFVFHQANRRILAAVAERLGVDPARVVDAIAGVGNTSAASIPLALAHARPAPGERVLLGAMGAGFVYGAGVMVWA